MSIPMSRRKSFAIAAGGIGAAMLDAVPWSAYAQGAGPLFVVKRIPAQVIENALRMLFTDVKLKLNNYNGSHHIGNASRLTLSPALGGQTFTFTIPEWRKGPYFYYVNDVNLREVSIGRTASQFRIVLHFESGGTEIKGRCFHNKLACLVGNDKAAPDIQWNNGAVEVLLTPAPWRNGLAYGDIAVNVLGNFQAGGICKLKFADICNIAFDYKDKIRAAVRSIVVSALASPGVKDKVAGELRPWLLLAKVGMVVGAKLDGPDLAIRHNPKG